MKSLSELKKPQSVLTATLQKAVHGDLSVCGVRRLQLSGNKSIVGAFVATSLQVETEVVLIASRKVLSGK